MKDEELNKGDLVSFISPPIWGDLNKRSKDGHAFPGIIIDEWDGEELDWYGYPNERKVYLVYWSNGLYSREYDCYLKKISSKFRTAAAVAAK